MRIFNRLQRTREIKPPPHLVRLYTELLKALNTDSTTIAAPETIGPYIVDFCIYPQRVAILIGRPQRKSRESYLANIGMRVLIFTSGEAEESAASVAQRIAGYCKELG